MSQNDNTNRNPDEEIDYLLRGVDQQGDDWDQFKWFCGRVFAVLLAAYLIFGGLLGVLRILHDIFLELI